MRSLYNPNFTSEKVQEDVIINAKDEVHHLLKVVRLKIGEEIMILNGLGDKAIYKVVSIDRTSLKLKLIQTEKTSKNHQISLMLGIPKKEFYEECLRSAICLGIENLIHYSCERGQYKPEFTSERILKIQKSSYEQSNNPYQVNLSLIQNLEDCDMNSYKHKILFTTNENKVKKYYALKNLTHEKITQNLKKEDRTLIAIGPEGGFSDSEVDDFIKNGFLPLILPCPILKTTQALNVGVGHILGAQR